MTAAVANSLQLMEVPARDGHDKINYSCVGWQLKNTHSFHFILFSYPSPTELMIWLFRVILLFFFYVSHFQPNKIMCASNLNIIYIFDISSRLYHLKAYSDFTWTGTNYPVLKAVPTAKEQKAKVIISGVTLLFCWCSIWCSTPLFAYTACGAEVLRESPYQCPPGLTPPPESVSLEVKIEEKVKTSKGERWKTATTRKMVKEK